MTTARRERGEGFYHRRRSCLLTEPDDGDKYISSTTHVYLEHLRKHHTISTFRSSKSQLRPIPLSNSATRRLVHTAAMPLWKIYAHPDTFTPAQRAAIAQDITALYVNQINLPAFYVNVFFIPLEQDSMFFGGEPRKNFVRITADHIARTMPSPDTQAGRDHRNGWMDAVNQVCLRSHVVRRKSATTRTNDGGRTNFELGLEAAHRRPTRTRVGTKLYGDAIRPVESRRSAAATAREPGGAGMEEKQQSAPVHVVECKMPSRT